MPTPYVFYSVAMTDEYLHGIMVGPIPLCRKKPRWYYRPIINRINNTEFDPAKIAEISGVFVQGIVPAKVKNLNGCKLQTY